MSTKRGIIVVISGPSGSGKGTLISGVRERDSNVRYAVSATTRDMRPGEIADVHYHFKSDSEFDSLIENGDVLEWDEFCGHRYGTLKSEIENKIEQGYDIVLDLTVPGARAIKKAFPDDAVSVFILPPSVEELENRIRHRQRETEQQLAMRLVTARKEAESACEFDYTVINNDLETAVDALWSVFKAQRLTYTRNKETIDSFTMKGAI